MSSTAVALRRGARSPLFLATAATLPLAVLLNRLGLPSALWTKIRSFPPAIYDAFVLHMTEVWYRRVLDRLDDGSVILDVGIGTAGALLRCKDLLVSKRLVVVGIDYNEMYVSAAKRAIAHAGVGERVKVVCMSVYDTEGLCSLAELLSLPESTLLGKEGCADDDRRRVFDAVYFSGSFSLLPSPSEALDAVASEDVLRRDGAGRVYITQTFQRRTPPLFGIVKPLVKYVSTIDFGRLITEGEVMGLYGKSERLEVEEHGVMEGSVKNYFQAAYLSVLRLKEDR